MLNNEMSQSANAQALILSRKSWITYIFGITIAVFTMVTMAIIDKNPPMGSIIFDALALAATFVFVKHLRSFILYMDEDGVWLLSGMFPWSRAVNGTKWRDIEAAYFNRGFFHWATSSYPVFIVNRFTRRTEISLTNMAHGNLAVQMINEKLQSMARTSHLQ